MTSYKVLIFDVDGTLYCANRLRRRILLRLLFECALRPRKGLATARAIASYRRAQDALRGVEDGIPDLRQAQLEMAVKRSGLDAARLRAAIAEWMERRPLGLLRACRRNGLPELLAKARQGGCKLAVFSDYSAEQKLEALGLRSWFDFVACAQDRDVGRFKPDPRGIEVVLRRLAVDRRHALYIGDQPELDAVAAGRAGVACAIIGSRRRSRGTLDYLPIRELGELSGVVAEPVSSEGRYA